MNVWIGHGAKTIVNNMQLEAELVVDITRTGNVPTCKLSSKLHVYED